MRLTCSCVAMRDALGEALVALGERHPELVVLDADVSSSTKTAAFGQRWPERFFNLGVAESNMVDVAAGLATCGLRPLASTFALFLALKGADQVRNTICYNNLPVILAGGYAGLSDSFDGASHQSITDLAVMRAMPGMTVVAPSDAADVAAALEEALRLNGPCYLRLCRNPTPDLSDRQSPFQLGPIRILREGSDLTLAACGVMVAAALEAAEQLAEQGIQAQVLNVATLKPLDEATLLHCAVQTGRVLTVEEHNVIGGLGAAVAQALGDQRDVVVDSMGVTDCFTESGDYADLMQKYGLSAGAIVQRAQALMKL